MKQEIKTSTDFGEILRRAREASLKKKLPIVFVEEVLIQLIDYYEDLSTVEERNPVIQKIFAEMGYGKLRELKNDLRDSLKERSLSKYPEGVEVKDPALDIFLNSALQVAQDISKLVHPKEDGEVGADTFLASLFGSDLSDLLEKYVEGSKLMSYMYAFERAREVIEKSLGGALERSSSEGVVKSEDILDKEIPTSVLKEDDDKFETYGNSEPINTADLDPNSTTPFLDNFSFDMTKKASEGKYDPVIGREEVVDSILEILCKRKKPNVCLTGLPGVGKTSIVERLAQRISDGEVPEKLAGKRICALNLNDLVAGTKYRGEYEERLQKIIKEVCSDKNVIIYIDEFHNLIGNGGQSGSGDGANILKPYLSRGDFQCIGSTTTEEYRKFIERDKALERRFTNIEIQEPDSKETLQILKAVISKYENYHKVRYAKESLEFAVDWSNRYITEKQQPDKAIDIIDMAGSIVELRKEESKEKQSLIEELNRITEEKGKALRVDKDFERLENLDIEEKQKQQELNKVEKGLENKKNWPEVTKDSIAECISKVSKVPIDKIAQTDIKKMSVMKEEISKRVIGQEKAIKVVTEALQRNVLGLRNPKKPIASILVCGPTGVGKTLLCKEIASIFFGSEKALIKIDGGTLKGGEMAVNTLIGSSAGYVGYGDDAVLEKVKRLPRCVLLFDEIEKADKAVYDVLLSILDEGTVKLNNNSTVHFENCIIIFTSNLGAKEMKNKISLGFDDDNEKINNNEEIVKKAVEKNFRPEFINRLSSIITFNELGEKELYKIFDLELKKIKDTLIKSKISFKVSTKLKKHIVNLCTEGLGARELSRHIEELIISPLSNQLLETPDNKKYEVDLDDSKNVMVK